MNMKTIITITAVAMYVFVIAFQSKKVVFTTLAAAAVILLGTFFPGEIFPLPEDILALEGDMPVRTYALIHSVTEIINWNVIMIYLGSMTIAAMFIYSKVPVRIADAIVNSSGNTCLAMVAILAMTGIISIFVENVATVLVMAPIALALCKKLEMKPTFFMVGLAVMSNLEGTATLVGDPPSMIFASYAGYNFNDFFVHQGKISIFFIIQTGMIAGCVFFYAFFAKYRKKKVTVEKEDVVSWVPFVIFLIMVGGLAVMSFVNPRFEFSSGTFVLGLGVLCLLWYLIFQRKTLGETGKVVSELDWETIFFLLGIFVVVGAIKETGLLHDFARYLVGVTGGSKIAGFLVILLVSVFISGFVDNVPYIIAMLPVAGSMAHDLGLKPELYLFAILIGSCLGGNLTPFGASANVVAMGIIKKEGHPMNFAGWLKIGAPFTFITTAASALLLWCVWK